MTTDIDYGSHPILEGARSLAPKIRESAQAMEQGRRLPIELVDAMKRADSIDPKRYLKELPKTDYTGITGRIRFKEDGDIRERPVMLMTYDAGKKVLLQEIK